MLLTRKGKKKKRLQTLIIENVCHYDQKQRLYCNPGEKKVILIFFFFIGEEVGLVRLENSKINSSHLNSNSGLAKSILN